MKWDTRWLLRGMLKAERRGGWGRAAWYLRIFWFVSKWPPAAPIYSLAE